MDLGQRLRKAREAAGLTQKQLEERSGASQKTISKIERGDQEGSTQVARLARACGVNTDWLANEVGPMSGALHVAEPASSYAAQFHDKALRELIDAWPNLHPAGRTLILDALELAQKHFSTGAHTPRSGRAQSAAHAAAAPPGKRESLLPPRRRGARQRS